MIRPLLYPLRSLSGAAFLLAALSLSLFTMVWWELRGAPTANQGLLPDQPTALQAQSDTPAMPLEPIKLVFVGDLMFDRYIRTQAERRTAQQLELVGEPNPTAHNYDFTLTGVAPLFTQADAVIGNLEGPVTSQPSISQGSEVGSPQNFTFTFDPEVLKTLQQYSFVLNLGNNHILNFGETGLVETEQRLTAAEIPFFGQRRHLSVMEGDTARETYTTTLQGVTITFINYNQFLPETFQRALTDLHQAQELTDVQIVYTHWGIEYAPVANPVITQQAHQLVDAGADLVIGSHPHVIQNQEIYQDVPIYYSLGNFVFDQYFEPAVQEGLLVTVTIDPETLELTASETGVQILPTGETVLN